MRSGPNVAVGYVLSKVGKDVSAKLGRKDGLAYLVFQESWDWEWI